MNFAIRYLTEYRYDTPVTDNLNALRVRPATTSTSASTTSTSASTPRRACSRHLDYFGTEVIEFGVTKPHDHLTIDVRARVVTAEPPTSRPRRRGTRVESPAYRAGGRRVPAARRADEPGRHGRRSRSSRRRGARRHAAGDAARRLPSGSPTASSTAPARPTSARPSQDLIDAGAGVCQDFVHLALILLRRHGIAARYVSGYLWAAPDGRRRRLGRGRHARVARGAAARPGGRGEPVWVGVDPTNRRLAGETHVKIGHGRHYPDVPPIKGVYRGAAGAQLDAGVRMTRLDPKASARA